MKKFISPRYAKWDKNFRKQTVSKFRNFHFHLFGLVVRFFSNLLHLHPKTFVYVKKGIQLGNPAKTVWPIETLPMISRLLSGGLWNWSFFQFHRNFYFPYWAERQYNPKDKSFIPRSHNILSINQTHRNWLSVSFPGKPSEVSLDPSAAIMPFLDSFTIEFSCIENEKLLRAGINSPLPKIKLISSYQLKVQWLSRIVYVAATPDGVHIKGEGKKNIILSVRPFNMEGASFLYHLEFRKNRLLHDASIYMSESPQAVQLGSLHKGDSLQQMTSLLQQKTKQKNFDLQNEKSRQNNRFSLRKKFKRYIQHHVYDMAGLANASFFYSSCDCVSWQVKDNMQWSYSPNLPSSTDAQEDAQEAQEILDNWFPALTQLNLPKPLSSLFFHARSHLITLWDFDSITPGSFTYHHFWIRDAAFMLHALLLVGGEKAVKKILLTFSSYIAWDGRFRSQAGEWDSNGQALWIIGKYVSFTQDTSVLFSLQKKINKMLLWIKKIIEKNNGLMPAGFSAEHLGTSDKYLWDTFWTLGGLHEIIPYQEFFPKIDLTALYQYIHSAVENKLHSYNYYPAAIGRRKDAGMIGSLSPLYPLHLPEYFNKRIIKTLQILQKDYFFHGCFYQENIHSGINPYLSLQTAEAFLHLGDGERALSILHNVLNWKSIAYTFPEAVHPRTKGGCMGDGFHGWAFSEIVVLLKNFFLLEINQFIFFLPVFTHNYKKENISAHDLHSSCGKINIDVQGMSVEINGIKKFSSAKGSFRFFLVLPKQMKNIKPIEGIKKLQRLSPNDLNMRSLKKQTFLEVSFTENFSGKICYQFLDK